MRYINVKRIILNIGLLILLGTNIWIGRSVFNNHNATYTTAEIVSSEPSGNCFYQESDGNEIMYDNFTVTYVVDGQTYEGSISRLPGEYEIGDIVQYCYNKEYPEQRFYDTLKGDLWLLGSLAGISIMIIFICRKAFKGYWNDYIFRYKKQVVFSIITGWIPVLYYLWFEYIFEPQGFFAGLSEYLFLLFLTGVVPVVNIVVWIVSAMKYAKNQKNSEKN